MRKQTIEFTMTTPNDVNFNIEIERVVPGGDNPAYMKATAHLCDEDGNYDTAMKILDIKGIDTLEIQCILIKIKQEIAAMTSVHVN